MPSNLSFFDKLAAVEGILAEHSGSPLAIDALKEYLEDDDVKREFLRKLDQPEWVTPLRDAGYFEQSPTFKVAADASVQYPPWYESQFLRRMASRAPAEVAEILANIESENPSIVRDIVDAALQMPTEYACKLVPSVCSAAREGTLWFHFKDAGDLCVQLAQSGEVDTAMFLADALYTPRLGEGQESPNRRDIYWYKDGLKKIVPILASKRAQDFVPRLCEWLKEAIEAKGHIDLSTGDDHSCSWRPAIEEHNQNRDYDFAGAMVGFTREGFECAIRADQVSLDQAIVIADRYPFLVFKRIRVHLINQFANENLTLALETMLNRELFDSYRFKHEYAMLVGRCFPLLLPEERTKWFGWIDAGPDMSGFEESVRRNRGRDATDEDRAGRIRHWQFEKLHWVREHLEGSRKEFYDRVLAEEGEPHLADVNIYMSTAWAEHSSPMTVEELSSTSFENAVEKVASWKPEKRGVMTPDIEGLASTFEQYVAVNPGELSSGARFLIGRPSPYVRRFVDQMSQAVASGTDIDVRAVFELCKWVIERPIGERSTPAEELAALVDRDWEWTRNSISRFVQSLCRSSVDNAPKYPPNEFRDATWRLLRSLCTDPATSCIIYDADAEDPRVRDYLDFGINSPRGKAVEAALDYARWVADHIREFDGDREHIPGGFDSMPEVREMLEWQIVSPNRSFEALSIIGSKIGALYRIDKQWLAENSNRLFNLHGIEEHPPSAHGWAAWNAFLVWMNPHVELYRIFRNQYAYAVDQAAIVEISDRSQREPMYHLGEHLVLLYGRGNLGLDDDDGLVRRFFINSNPDIRRHAIGYVGQSLDTDDQVPDAVLDRFKALWEMYWSNVGKRDAEERPEAWLFGTWFASGQFSDEWALEQLEQFVDVVPIPEPDHEVMEQLAKCAESHVAASARVLDRIVRGVREGWRIDEWSDSVGRILALAMNADQESRSISTALIDHLGRRGYIEFGELLG